MSFFRYLFLFALLLITLISCRYEDSSSYPYVGTNKQEPHLLLKDFYKTARSVFIFADERDAFSFNDDENVDNYVVDPYVSPAMGLRTNGQPAKSPTRQ